MGDMLQKLLDKFTDEKTTLEKEETNSKHAYDMLMQDLNAQIKQATRDSTSKSEEKAKTLQHKADAEGDLKDTTESRDADAKYLADLTATCEQEAADFEAKQQLRADEIVAIEKGIEIMTSDAVSFIANKHAAALWQKKTKKTSSLVQLRSDLDLQAQSRVALYLQARAKKL